MFGNRQFADFLSKVGIFDYWDNDLDGIIFQDATNGHTNIGIRMTSHEYL